MSELIDLDIAIKLNKNYYRRQGRNQEQNRIIKLLEKELVFHEPVVINRHKLIALIKGEK